MVLHNINMALILFNRVIFLHSLSYYSSITHYHDSLSISHLVTNQFNVFQKLQERKDIVTSVRALGGSDLMALENSSRVSLFD